MAKISNTALFDPKGDADIKSGIDSVENAIVALDLPGGLNSSAIDKAVIDAKQIDADIKDIEEQAQQNLSIPGIDKTSKEYQAVKHDYEKLSMLEKQLDEDIKKLERDRKNPNVSKEQIKKDLEKIESDIFKIAAAKQHLKTDLITLDLVYKSNPISEIKRLFYKIFKPETITVIW
jgi:chromosome segregation ATPase